MKKFEWPVVWRKDADAKRQKEVAALRKSESERRLEMQAQWDTKWKPLLDKMVSLSATRRPDYGSFILHVELDRSMLEQAAGFNDPTIWRYISEMTGHNVERQLATLNFAGLHRLADELEDRNHRANMARFPVVR